MMGDTKEALVATLIHSVELAVCLGAAWLAVNFLGVSGEGQMALVALVVAAIAKFARAHEDIPVGDYVNDRK